MGTKSIVLQFDEKVQKQYAIDTGEILPSSQSYSLDLKDFSPEERAEILEVTGSIEADRVPQTREDWMELIRAHLDRVKQEANQRIQKYLGSEEELTREALRSLKNYTDTNPVKIFGVGRADESLLAALRERWAVAMQRAREIQAREKQEEEARRKAQEEREQAQRKAREGWILTHGSERLVKGFQMGYSCTGLFEKEFTAFHFPQATLDWHDKARWEKRRCPSLEALQRVEEYEKRFPDWEFEIVWLTSPPRPFGMHEEDYAGREYRFEPHEAIVIKIPGFTSHVFEEV